MRNLKQLAKEKATRLPIPWRDDAGYRPICELLKARLLMSGSPAVWTGAAGDSKWSTPGNWDQDAVPAVAQDVSLPAGAAGAINVDSAGVEIGNLMIGGGGYSLSGNAIAMDGNIVDSGSSSISNNISLSNDQEVNVDAGSVLTFNGQVEDNTFHGITKDGAGTLLIGGAGSIAYSGQTNVTGGTLDVEGSIASAVSVDSGAALDGDGYVGRIIISGGTLSPGDNSNPYATLNSGGGVTLDSASTIAIQLDGNTTGNGAGHYSQITTGDNVTLNGATLNLSLGPDYTPAAGDTLTLIANGGSVVNGTFNGLAEARWSLRETMSFASATWVAPATISR